ncbi:MAG: hypothetical protein ABIR71_10570 [Chthoniobacterales bacterium]
MRASATTQETGSTLLCTLGVVVILSAVGANVLMNCVTRYNATAKQVKGWKEALYAAEAGGDIGYAEARRAVPDASNAFLASRGWAQDASATNPTWTKTIPPFGSDNSLATTVSVDRFTVVNGNPYYRIRAIGTAAVNGLRRSGIDDRMNATTRGDSLLRKIDFSFDHFRATYGHGDTLATDPGTVANGKALTAVPRAQVKRRIELVAVPVMSFEGAIKCLSAFAGPGSAGVIDSYNSINGSYALANASGLAAQNPNSPYYADSRNGNVAVNTPSFNQGNVIYGDVSTNGGNLNHTNSQITGTIDNNVPFYIPPWTQPVLPAGVTYESTSPPDTITPPVRYESDGVTQKTEFWYLYTGNFKQITINPVYVGSNPVETQYNIIVNGDVGEITVQKGANVRIHFKGNFSAQLKDLDNKNVDGYGAATSVKMVNPNRDNDPSTNDSYVDSDRTSSAGHLMLYGISPTNGATQTIELHPPGDMRAVIYAPSANVTLTGNPDILGAVVCKSFSGNGNTGFHFDNALTGVGIPIDYRVASYVEDIR